MTSGLKQYMLGGLFFWFVLFLVAWTSVLVPIKISNLKHLQSNNNIQIHIDRMFPIKGWKNIQDLNICSLLSFLEYDDGADDQKLLSQYYLLM